ncbi:hypothetical protein FRC04_009077 [Tulasnella sp. 424]|nr:hypothetical protein FRC04_009077 [Tulasnella sp. 424]
MNQLPRENVCNLCDLSKSSSEVQDIVERNLSKGIQYCCRSWAVHLTAGKRWSKSGAGGVDRREVDFEIFSKEKVLCWLEVMSLVGATNEAASTAKQVYQWLSQRPNVISRSNLLVVLWSDVQRFLAAFSSPISFGPLHIYASALAHCPLETELWRCYGRFAKIRTIRGLQALTWPPNLWTRLTDSAVSSVAFSPDGALVAFGSADGTICLCDAQTWRQVGEPLTGHTGRVNSVCFSPDGKLLASESGDRTIRLWDPQTRKQFGEPLTGDTLWVYSVCFSPDSKLLASGSGDRTIRLWDPQTRKQFGEPLTGHTDLVRSVCFSPDGKLLASGSGDQTIRLWDPQTGKQFGEPLTGHTNWVNSVCFSPDGKLLASGSGDRTIRLWDPQTGKQFGEPLTGHTSWVNSVCFSPDGKLLASGSTDKTICLWDLQTGKQFSEPLTGHTNSVNSVYFSPDGKLLASGSEDQTIRLWDPQTGKQFAKPLTGHTNWVSSVCFSPDGKLLASESWDQTICLWDPQTGKQVGEPLKAHSDNSQLIWDTLALERPDIQPNAPSPVTSAFVKDHWVTLSFSRLFWLPPQYWHPSFDIMILSRGKLAVTAEESVYIFDVSSALELDHRLAAYS